MPLRCVGCVGVYPSARQDLLQTSCRQKQEQFPQEQNKDQPPASTPTACTFRTRQDYIGRGGPSLAPPIFHRSGDGFVPSLRHMSTRQGSDISLAGILGILSITKPFPYPQPSALIGRAPFDELLPPYSPPP